MYAYASLWNIIVHKNIGRYSFQINHRAVCSQNREQAARYCLFCQPGKELFEECGELGLLFFAEPECGGNFCRNVGSFFLELVAFVGDGDDEMAAVELAAAAAQIAFLLEGFEHWREGAAVEIEQAAHDLAVGLAKFPEHGHRQVLGVGQIQRFEQGFVGADELFGAGV